MVRSHIWAVSITEVLWAPPSSGCPLQFLVARWQLWGVHPRRAPAVLSLPQPWLWTLGEGSGEEGWGWKAFAVTLENLSFLAVGSTSSSPALLGIREPRSEYDRTHPSMQYYSSQGDVIAHKDIYTGKRQLRVCWNRELFLVGRVHSRTQPPALVGCLLPTAAFHLHSLCFLVVAQGRVAPALLFSVKLPTTRVSTDPFIGRWEAVGILIFI